MICALLRLRPNRTQIALARGLWLAWPACRLRGGTLAVGAWFAGVPTRARWGPLPGSAVLTLPCSAPWPRSPGLAAQTIKLSQISATVGVDYDLNTKVAEPKWQLESSLGRVLDVQATAAGCTLSKNWDADLGAMSCNVEVRGHCTWSGRVRPAPPSHAAVARERASGSCLTPPAPVAADTVDRLRAHPHGDQGCHRRHRVRCGEVAGREPPRQSAQAARQGAATLSGCLCHVPPALTRCGVQIEVGASIYKEGAEPSDSLAKDDVLCLKIKSVNAIVTL